MKAEGRKKEKGREGGREGRKVKLEDWISYWEQVSFEKKIPW